MSDHLYERLSAYLDGELDGPDRAAAEQHLAACAQCRDELDGLRRVVRRAAALDDRPPAADLWHGIQERIGTAGTADVVPITAAPRRVTFTVPQLAAAAVLLMALSSGAAFLTRSRSTPAPPAGPAAAARLVADPGAAAVAAYDSIIRSLRVQLAARRGQFDTATVRVVEQSLAVIDAAIRQAQTALARDPANMYLNGQLQSSLDRKIDLLRRAATLPAI